MWLQSVGQIDGDWIVIAEGCGRDSERSLKISSKRISIKESINLETPHEVIGNSEFWDIIHVDVEERLSDGVYVFMMSVWVMVEQKKKIWIFKILCLLITCKSILNLICEQCTSRGYIQTDTRVQ